MHSGAVTPQPTTTIALVARHAQISINRREIHLRGIYTKNEKDRWLGARIVAYPFHSLWRSEEEEENPVARHRATWRDTIGIKS
jgi:hypothetical protein